MKVRNFLGVCMDINLCTTNQRYKVSLPGSICRGRHRNRKDVNWGRNVSRNVRQQRAIKGMWFGRNDGFKRVNRQKDPTRLGYKGFTFIIRQGKFSFFLDTGEDICMGPYIDSL